MEECLITHIRTHLNVSDLASKIIPGGTLRSKLVDMLLYDVESQSTAKEDMDAIPPQQVVRKG